MTAAAIVAPTIAGASFMVVSAWQRRASVAFAAAYVVLPTGPVAYGLYVIRGTADVPDTAGHIRVIVFPILHTVSAGLRIVGAAWSTLAIRGGNGWRHGDSKLGRPGCG